MKYSQQAGLIAAVLLIVVCFFPWTYIASRQITITGLSAVGTNFGKPGLFNIVMSAIAAFLFLIPRLWAKRTNVFVCAINLAWSIRNYIILSTCLLGECPEKKVGLYLLVVLAIATQLMALFPKLEVKQQ
ncbi:hypothetical protein [Asinibacterium sp. OR53]|jgi:hypothetical protein|uniref:hypothetical protein n=1 Tax=Asinibacterium sp. OR53 TaxID=925409 RepID=UPI0003F787B8|nr:hypothetical protein [Asinibacterium sp. OR53]